MRSAKQPRSVRLERFSPAWTDYQLIDSGSGRKLERFGQHTLIRPEPQAVWSPALPESRWSVADAAFLRQRHARTGEWKHFKAIPPRWTMRRASLEFWVQPAPSGHVGVFPDQAFHWDWISAVVKSVGVLEMLSLFGHTGLATLSAAAAGARVTHVDASQKAVRRARENQSLSGLSNCSIRWIVEDALRFVSREVKRGHKYDALILDPPRFGRGPKGEIWKTGESLPILLGRCRELLSSSPVFVLLNTYTTVVTRGEAAAEALKLRAYLQEMLAGYPVNITAGELTLADSAGRQLSASVFARAVVT